MTKNYRQGQILKLIRAKRINTQEELGRELKAVGIDTTQVTLSRDIRELGLAKTREGYVEILPDPTGPDLATVMAEYLLDVRLAQSLVVLKTSSGSANSLAVALDCAADPFAVDGPARVAKLRHQPRNAGVGVEQFDIAPAHRMVAGCCT